MSLDTPAGDVHGARVPVPRPRVFYRIGEVAALVGVSPQVLRHWEEVLGVPQPMKTRGSHRHYKRHDVELAMRVRALLETEGLTLSGVKKRLALGPEKGPRGRRAALVGLREELEALRRALTAPTRKLGRPIAVPDE